MNISKLHPPTCSTCINLTVLNAAHNPLFFIGDNLLEREFMEFDKGEYLYKAGEKAIGSYCIREGKVKIYKNGKKLLRIAGNGEVIGFNSVSNGKYNKSVRAASAMVFVCFIPFDEINRIIKLLSALTHRSALFELLAEECPDKCECFNKNKCAAKSELFTEE